MRIVLIDISSVSSDKTVESIHKIVLTLIISEVESFEVMNENMAGHILDAGDLPTLIDGVRYAEDFVGSVGDYFSASGAVFSPNSHIMVALYPKAEEAFACSHLVVGLLVVVKPFHVVDVVLDIAAAAVDY